MKIIFPRKLEGLLYEYSKKYPKDVIDSYRDVVKIMQLVQNSHQLYSYQSLRTHRLHGDKDGELGIYLDYHWRLQFRILNDGSIEIIELIRISNHYQ